MQNTIWNLKESVKNNIPSLHLDKDILNILSKRGITKKQDIIKFIKGDLIDLENPSLLEDLDKATKRLILAIKNNENICIYGDYDVDGITSTSILYLGLKRLGASNVDFYIPIRDEGYGLNNEALKSLKDKGTDLVITVDCGITSYKEIDYANEIGLEVIITDHHNLLKTEVPKAYAVINPKRLENKYSFRELAGVGTAFMLLLSLFEAFGQKEKAFEYIDLVAIGTIADVVPLIKENRIIVKSGLKMFETTKNLGLKMLLEKCYPDKKEGFSSGDVAFGISPIFNAAGRLKDAKLAVYLLISNNPLEIRAIIEELLLKNFERKEIQNKIFELAKKTLDNKEEYILISSSPKYHHGVIGIVAAKIVDTYYKPAIILEEKVEEGIAVASCRSIANFDITKALQHCSSLLEKFGGHTGAAGFTIKIENIEEFSKKINEYAKKTLKASDFCRKIFIDEEIPMQKISYEFYKTLELLEPFGFGNPTPIFITKNVIVDNAKLIGDSKNHISFDVSQKGFLNKGAVWFFKGEYFNNLNSGVFYDIVYKISLNKFKGRYYTKIYIEDMKESLLKDDKYKYLKSLYETSFPIKSLFYTNENLSLDSNLSLDISFDKVLVFNEQKFLSKLDNNISRLLISLNNFYGFNFKAKINDLIKEQDFYAVEILINKDFDFLTYKKNDANLFNKIKEVLLNKLDYDSTTKLALASLFKDNSNILLSKKNLSSTFYNNILLTFAMYNKKKNNKNTLMLTKNANLLNIDRLMFFTVKKEDVDNTYLIYDKNTYNKEIDTSKFDKVILIDDSIEEKEGFISIKHKLEENKRIKKLNKNNLDKYGSENVFIKYLPLNDKIAIKDILENTEEIILSDDSIYEIL